MSHMRLGFSVDDIIKNDKKIKSDIDAIQKWIRGQPLPTLLDEQILIFLVAAENDVQTAMKIIKGHYRMKQARPDVFAARNLNEEMRRNLRAMLTCILPVRHNDSVIFFCKLRERSYGDFDLRCALAILMMFPEVAVFNGPPKSATFLIDGSGVSQGEKFSNFTRQISDIVKAHNEDETKFAKNDRRVHPELFSNTIGKRPYSQHGISDKDAFQNGFALCQAGNGGPNSSPLDWNGHGDLLRPMDTETMPSKGIWGRIGFGRSLQSDVHRRIRIASVVFRCGTFTKNHPYVTSNKMIGKDTLNYTVDCRPTLKLGNSVSIIVNKLGNVE